MQQPTAPDSPLPWVVLDETRFKQILFNLINNAVKFTERGVVTVRVSQAMESTLLSRLVISVQDTGIGMDAKGLSHLFQRFHQVDNSTTRKFGGTGLGLEISQSLARMMGGDITVSSVLGEGSVFTASLLVPRSEAPSEPAPVALPPAVAPARSAGANAQGAPSAPRILVVEDHPINQKLVGVLLGRMGLHVTFCENGQLALDRVAVESFDVILMDVNMPVMDGLTATRAIRAMSGAVAKTPIVVFTADVMNEATEMARDAGADDFLGKPVKVEQLRTTICKYLEGFEPKNN